MFGQGLDFGSITNVGEPLVTSFTSTSTVVNSSLTALYGISYNPNDGYIYTREQNFGPTTFTGLIKRNATTGAYISQAGNFLNVGFNIQFFDIYDCICLSITMLYSERLVAFLYALGKITFWKPSFRGIISEIIS